MDSLPLRSPAAASLLPALPLPFVGDRTNGRFQLATEASRMATMESESDVRLARGWSFLLAFNVRRLLLQPE